MDNMDETEAKEKVGTCDTEVTDDATLVELEPSFPEDTIVLFAETADI
ncbi:26733_t:CDS:2 [Dentiscutata erythropus]|uniref:26733_t:CDS:1 n=1 Tax=Dentiscutata erythropus TaxID=1348616 RepID=A0A9N9NQ19_9GLOM|nr:26733_t:CDS:2 [Dentiscutata erythropus]